MNKTPLPPIRDMALRLGGAGNCVSALRRFEEALAQRKAPLADLCREFLADINVHCSAHGPQLSNGDAHVFYADTPNWLTLFLLPTLCPKSADVKLLTGFWESRWLGPNFAKYVSPIGDCENHTMRRRAYSTWSRICRNLYRLLNWWYRPAWETQTTIAACIRHLQQGGSLCMLPGGVMGDVQWSWELGHLVQTYLRQSSSFAKGLRICPADVVVNEPAAANGASGRPMRSVTIRYDCVDVEGAIPLVDPANADPETITRMLAVNYHYQFRSGFLSAQIFNHARCCNKE